MIKAIILDFDDTLCLTEEACYELEQDILKEMGMPPMPRKLHLETWGKPLFEVIGVRSPNIDEDKFRELFDEHLPRYIKSGKLDKITPDNFAALDKIIASGKQIYVLTSRTEAELGHILQPDHELSERIEAYYHKDNMDHHKPDPRAFDIILSSHGLLPSECVYVGDSVSDAEASNGRAIQFIASLESGLRSKKDFNGNDVTKFISKFTDLPTAIVGLDSYF